MKWSLGEMLLPEGRRGRQQQTWGGYSRETLDAASSPDLGLEVRSTQKAGTGAIAADFLGGNDLGLLIPVTE